MSTHSFGSLLVPVSGTLLLSWDDIDLSYLDQTRHYVTDTGT